MSGHMAQGRQLSDKLNSFKETHGEYPAQSWFQDLSEDRTTSEGHNWIYFNPPKQISEYRNIILATKVNLKKQYKSQYFTVDTKGSMSFTSPESINNK